MPKRPNNVMEERVVIAVDHAASTGDRTDKIYKVPAGRKFRLERAIYVNVTGLAADASNYFNLKVLKGSTVMANWSTETGQAGTIAADTFVAFTNSATAANLVADADDVISLFLDETGTASLPAGRIVLEGVLI